MTAQPTDLARPGLLRDGRSLLIRPVREPDLPLLREFFGRLSRRTISYRTLGPVVAMDDRAAARLLEAETHGGLALITVLEGRIIGLAEYHPLPDNAERADVAFLIEDSFQGAGLGGLLLEHLASAARGSGIEVFEADVLADNIPMLRTLENSGYRVEFGAPGSVQHVDLAVDPRRQVISRSDQRERVATRSSMHALFEPRTVAVIGANRTGAAVGRAILDNLVTNGFTGTLHAVNPHTAKIGTVKSYPTIGDVPEQVDLAMVAVPAEAVREVLRECAESGVSTAVVVTSGVEDSGVAGRELVQSARAGGMRLVGPNCMGLVNLDPAIGLVATFSPQIPPPGRVSMASQSGPLGLAVLDHARRIGLGFAGFVSLGDSIDVSPNDLLQWWESDHATSVVLLHLDSFGNPRKFARLARRVAARKPIITVQPGPDTAAMAALFDQAGIIHTRTMQEMFDTALLLAHQPVPPGRRVAVLTNAGGPGALTAGACLAAGLEVAGGAPLDLTPMATGDDYRTAMTRLLDDDAVDAVIVLFIPPLVARADEVGAAVLGASAQVPAKPVVASFLSHAGVPPALRDGRQSIPSFLFPESAAVALGHAAVYGEWRRAPAGVLREQGGLDLATARQLVAKQRPGWAGQAVVSQLLACFGLPGGAAAEAPEGHDLTLRVLSDPIFGPVLSLGLADGYAQLFGDVAFRITPLSDRDAEAMIRSLRAFPLLDGSAGEPPADLPALTDVLLRVSTLVERIPELADLEIRRLRVGRPGEGAALLDAAMRLEAPAPARVVQETTVDLP